MMDDEIPERDLDSTSVPTDLTITENTISSSDLVPSPAGASGRTFDTKALNGRNDQHYGKQTGERRSAMKQRSLEEKYNSLLIEVNELRVTQVSQVSTLEAELKLKSFEFKRSQQQIKSLQSQLKVTAKEKEEACIKVKCLTDELNSTKRTSDQEICNLTMSLHEKTLKLEMYEKIQTKIDHVLFPDLPVSDTAGEETEVEGILSNFGYGNISVDAKMRLQQSLDLAKRLANERDHLEKSRDDMQMKLNDVERKYHELLIELNHLKLTDKCQMSELQSELKLKKFEWQRLSALYSEVNEKYKSTLHEKERLSEKLDVMKEEFRNSKSNSDATITSLTLNLQEKTTRLETYDKLEAELDKVVVQAATLPDSDAEEVLAAYDYGSSIPSNLKRRLEQSLRLARRVLELEHFTAEQKTELFAIRDNNVHLKQELDAIHGSFTLSEHPTSELLKIIQKRNLMIAKLDAKVKELGTTITRITSSNQELEDKIKQVESKAKETWKPMSCLYNRISAPSQSTNSSRHSVIYSAKRGLNVSFQLGSRSNSQVILPLPVNSSSSSNSCVHIKKPLSFSKVRYQE